MRTVVVREQKALRKLNDNDVVAKEKEEGSSLSNGNVVLCVFSWRENPRLSKNFLASFSIERPLNEL
jgi:hypothetical protein